MVMTFLKQVAVELKMLSTLSWALVTETPPAAMTASSVTVTAALGKFICRTRLRQTFPKSTHTHTPGHVPSWPHKVRQTQRL